MESVKNGVDVFKYSFLKNTLNQIDLYKSYLQW